MDTLQENLRSLFIRDLNTLIKNLEATPEDDLWKAPEGVTNSCGVLAQHLVGNLNHFVGKGLGNTGYVRNRDREFADAHISKGKLIEDIEELKATLAGVFESLGDESLSEEYPLDIPFEATISEFLIHLYGHLNYHLGQVNYLRRILSSKNG